jgi:outer membrane protein OmpA-like peptidoglycan-associated protein
MSIQTATLVTTLHSPRTISRFLTFSATALLLAACASTPTAPAGSAEVRAKLTTLRTNTELASRAPIEIQAAETAVSAAERPQDESVQTTHLLLIANQKVEIANAWAQSRLYEDQRTDLTARSDAARLDARTREANSARQDASSAQTAADIARREASSAQTAADIARDQAAMARNEANNARTATNLALQQSSAARIDADRARAETAELQRQILELNAQMTDRGLVVTLGDVLFETGQSVLRGGTPDDLDRLASFLNRFNTRTVQIEGHTDSVGDDSSNLTLSRQRADSVQAYLVNRGIAHTRIATSGVGETMPIANNDTPTGRQQNRRVEVIISGSIE